LKTPLGNLARLSAALHQRLDVPAEVLDTGQPIVEEGSQELASKKTYPKSEISRFRYLIEGQSGRLAAMRITDGEIAQLEKNLNTFKNQTRAMDLEASAQTDFEFHQLIVEFSGVRLFRDLHLYFRDVIMQAVQMYGSQYSRAWEPVAEHDKIMPLSDGSTLLHALAYCPKRRSLGHRGCSRHPMMIT
jgi:DNA-binding FadR family transcriptional regulator